MTPRFNLPYIQASQSQKEVTHNEALLQLDALIQLVIEDRDLSAPPVSLSDGQVWYVNGIGSGDWLGQDGKLAHYDNSQWYFYSIPTSTRAWISDEAGMFVYNGSAWEPADTTAFIPVASVSGDYNATILDRGKFLAVDVTAAALEVRLPAATNGFPINLKKTDASANAITIRGAQNLITYSQELDNSDWSKSRTTVTANATTAPDGTLTADKIIDTTDSGIHEVRNTYSKPSGITRLTAGVRFKAAERTEAYLMLDNGSSANRAQIRVDLTDGSVPFDDQSGTFTLVSHSVSDIGNGWYLLAITVDVPTAADTITLTLRLYNGSSSYAGDSTSGVYAWGVQLVEGNLLGDYVAITDTPFTAQIDGADTHQITTQYQSLRLVSDSTDWLIL